MSVVTARKTQPLSESKNFKEDVLTYLGDISGIQLFNNHVLLATYIRPEKTKGNIIRPHSNVDEDEFQGKVGLVIKMGPLAFEDDDETSFRGQRVAPGDWVVVRRNDGWKMIINDVACQIVQDIHVRMKLSSPDLVF